MIPGLSRFDHHAEVGHVFTKSFWKSTIERSVKSFAQALAACLAGSAGLWEVTWSIALSVAGMTALLSVLTSLASIPVGSHTSPSLVTPGGGGAAVIPGQRVPEAGAVVAT